MTEIEDRLRRELTQVAEWAKPGQLRPLREPRARARVGWLAPLAAAAAVVAVVAAVWLAGAAIFHGPVSTVAPDTGMPRFYVVVTGPPIFRAVVHDSLTGRVLTTIPLPGRPDGAPWIAAGGDDRTFAIPVTSGQHSRAITRVFVLRISAAGNAGQLAPSPVTVPSRAAITGIALSPGGGKVALALVYGKVGARHSVKEIRVVSLATGTARTWTARGTWDAVINLAWTDGGRYLSFNWVPTPPLTLGLPQTQVRLLDTAGPSGNLLASQVIATRAKPSIGTLTAALLFADGHAMIALGLHMPTGPQPMPPPAGGNVRATLAELSVPGGHVVRRYPRPRGQSCYLLSAPGDGVHALLRCPAFERMDHGVLIRLPAIGSHSAAAW